MMSLEMTKKAYKEILSVIKKHKDICIFDIEDLEGKAKLHLFGLELKETYGLNIIPETVYSFDWIDCGKYKKIGLFGEKYNRKISWSDNDNQPTDERILLIQFPTGAYIFGNYNNKDYPIEFFNKFWMELLSFNPDYTDSHNYCLYWKIENAKEIFNSFEDIQKKYYELNKEDMKQRKIEKMKAELARLEGE
jgi:hypothetical protein